MGSRCLNSRYMSGVTEGVLRAEVNDDRDDGEDTDPAGARSQNSAMTALRDPTRLRVDSVFCLAGPNCQIERNKGKSLAGFIVIERRGLVSRLGPDQPRPDLDKRERGARGRLKKTSGVTC